MKQIIKNVRDCYNHIPYTWKHWIAFMKTEKKTSWISFTLVS